MKNPVFSMNTKVWLFPGEAPWHMTTVPKKQARRIWKLFADRHRGWRSLPVRVHIGKSRWQTSIFFDCRKDSYILPIKALVRKQEGIVAGQLVTVQLQVTL